jgi:dimethylaniline monooxygenase (N-oxide forming)
MIMKKLVDGLLNTLTITERKKEETFDAVLSATGHHASPKLPKWPGQEKFKGRIIHSKQYKDHRGFEGKNVVVVGVGNSGMDVCSELSRLANQVYMCTRRGVWIVTKVIDYGLPIDMWLNRRIHTYARKIIPPAIFGWLFERKIQQIFDHDKYGLRPNHSPISQHVSMSDDVHGKICSGQIQVVPNIKEFYENGIIFENGEKVEIDDVVLATGYLFKFLNLDSGNLFPVDDDNNVRVYKNMYPPQEAHKNTIAVIGLAQPIGSLMPISEMQARLFFSVLTGESKLPGKEGMNKEIDDKLAKLHGRYVNVSRHTIQVDYTEFMSELGDIIGCTPNPLSYLLSDPSLCYKLIFGPDVPYTYRLVGSKQWPGARDAIMDVDDRFLKGLQPHNSVKSLKTSNNGLYLVAGALLLFSLIIIWLAF